MQGQTVTGISRSQRLSFCAEFRFETSQFLFEDLSN